MKNIVKTVFAVFNCTILLLAILFFFKYENDFTSPISIMLSFTVMSCLIINICYLLFILHSFYMLFKKNQKKNRNYDAKTREKNFHIQQQKTLKKATLVGNNKEPLEQMDTLPVDPPSS